MTTRERWWEGLPDVGAQIDCGGHRHRITWRHGRLILEDHDVLAERALAALGSDEPPICIDVLDAWRRMRDADLLWQLLLVDRVVLPAQLRRRREHLEELKGAAATSARFQQLPAKVRRQLERSLVDIQARERRLWQLDLMETLPPALRRILALSIIVGLERRWHDDEVRGAHGEDVDALLDAIAKPLFEQSVRHWRRNLKPYASFVVDAHVVMPDDQPTFSAWLHQDGASAVVMLPLSWFVEIWGRDLALVDGCFVLRRRRGARGATTLFVDAVRWERSDLHTTTAVPAPALLTSDDSGRWSLQWV